MCECNTCRTMDMKTPRNIYLTAFYKRSFAFYTVKNRMPIILTTLIDNLVRSKNVIADVYGKEAQEELKSIIGEISELKYEIQTNKPLKPLTSEAPDAEIYNKYIQTLTDQEGQPTHFHTIWLLTECYMYRRLRQIFEKTTLLKDYDPFRSQKETAYITALPMIRQMGEHVLSVVENELAANKDEFISLLKLNLWGNKCDLSLSLGQVEDHKTLFDTAPLDPFILSDHSEKIWEAVSNTTFTYSIIDIVLDNSGYELFTDLCLADYIISKSLASKIRFYVKTIPWFISDVMTHDFKWTLDQLKDSGNLSLKSLGERWAEYLEIGTWQLVENTFWTLPYEFTYMSKVDPNLYRQLSGAKVAFFKGDLNYRKLFGERNWDPVTPVDDALQGFHPTKLCILRTVKADIVCGLADGVAERIEAEDPKWMGSGNWGLIQFTDKVMLFVYPPNQPPVADALFSLAYFNDTPTISFKQANQLALK